MEVPTDRKLLLEKLSKYELPKSKFDNADLMTKLYKHLVKDHPIHDLLKGLSNTDVKKVHLELKLINFLRVKCICE